MISDAKLKEKNLLIQTLQIKGLDIIYVTDVNNIKGVERVLVITFIYYICNM